MITETMTTLPASVPEPVREQAEVDLATHARDFDPRRLRIIAHRLLATLDPDGPEPTDEPTPPPRHGANSGSVTAETGALGWKAGWTRSTAAWSAP
ncbi:MAG: DUF222 domain-containing protein [Pseudonocardiales bacterium]